MLFVCALYLYLDLDFAYSFGFGFLFLIHELGHYYILKRLKIPVRGFYFIPLFGAVVISANQILEENQYAKFKFFGPLAGLVSVVICFIIYLITKEQLFIDLVLFGSVINLINLIPITFLDGHGVLRGSIKNIEWIGLLIGIFFLAFTLKLYAFSLLLVIISFLYSDKPNVKTTGLKIHEVVIAVLSILGILYLVITDKEYWLDNLIILSIAIYLFVIYLKATCFSKNSVYTTTFVEPLTKKNKIKWIVNYLLLSSALIAFLIAFYFYSR